jgi:phosphatidylserine/phosphatidylglycerophosphate/cardiolipin synthase-like enzyme
VPDQIDLGRLTISEGYFLIRDAESQPFVPEPDNDAEYRHRFTYRGSTCSIKQAALDLINGAQKKIFLASFRIGDRDLLDALFSAVDRLRGGVYVITSWTENRLRQDLATIEDLDDVDVQAQKKRFDELTRRGIALRGHESCHAKFLVVDDRAALVSSANLETSALADTPRKRATGENGVVITDPPEVDRLARFFTSLWYAGCTWDAPPGPEYALTKRDPTPSPVEVPPLTGDTGVIWTQGSKSGILTTLRDTIGLARGELLLATFSLRGLTSHPELLLDPLRQAMTDHRLDVRLLVRGRNNIAEHRADATALAKLGVAIHADSDTHAKGVIADARYGALFSANFEAEHGLLGGVEVGVRLDGRPSLIEAHRYFLHAMDHANLRFEPSPSQHDLDCALAARWRHRWRHDQRLTVTATNADWTTFTSASGIAPVLWEDHEQLRLYAADVVGTLTAQGGDRYRLAIERTSTDAATRLQRWFDERSRDNTPRIRRGFCPAQLIRQDP